MGSRGTGAEGQAPRVSRLSPRQGYPFSADELRLHLFLGMVVGTCGALMANAPYLVALALLEVGGQRALPLTGKSQAEAASEASDPGDEGRTLALELLLRIWQRSDEGPIQRAAGDNSLLLVEMPLELMSEQLPLLKATWIAGGDTSECLQRLQGLVHRGWRMVFAKYEPVHYQPWP